MTAVWWVRRDIRLADNGALQSAAAHGPVVPLFVWEDNLLAGAGDFRKAFMFDALNALDDSVGRALIYRDGPATDAVPEFCRLVGADTVHITEDFAPWGRARDAAVEKALAAAGVRLVRADTPYVIEAVTLLAAGLDVPLIGFAGGPFTVASYLIEGGPSKNFTKVKALMHGDPALWSDLMDALTAMAVTSLRSQLDAGASAIQVFDSWAGILAPHHYAACVLPWTRRLVDEIGASHPGTPTILFGVGTGELLPLMATAGTSVVGIDWRVPLDEARRRVGPGRAVQGNLDPALCLAGWDVVAAETRDVLARAGEAPGHIFNLGHGVLPETDPDVLARVVELVHAEGRAGVGGGR